MLISGLLGAGIALAEPATKPTTEPTSKPTADKGADDVVAVARGTVDLRLDLDGVFAPVDAVEIGAKTKAYQGEFLILSAAEPGPVKQGDVLLEIEPRHLKRQIAVAEGELANARANADKAKAEVALAVTGDELELKRGRDYLRNAEDALKWWNDNDSKMAGAMATIQDKIAGFQTESAEDELDQLKKMYKSDDLTNESADIVMKRAVRILDIYKLMSQVYGLQTKKLREYFLQFNKEQLVSSVDTSKQALAQLEVTQKQAQVTRRTAADAAALAVGVAEDKLDDLRKDLSVLTLKAPADGVLMYGSFKNKAWAPTPPEALRAGEKLQPQQVVMTLVRPGRPRVVAELPEAKLGYLSPGTKARIIPAARPDQSLPITVSRIDTLGVAKGEWQAFDVWFEMPETENLLPGFRGHVIVPGEKLSDVLVVPVSAVHKGRVWVKTDDGKDEPRDVTVGRSDSQIVEIKSGLKEGEKVLKQAKK